MELIKPQKQKVWKWPAATNFSLGGMGTGFYLIGLLVSLPQNGNWVQLLLSSPNSNWIQLAFLSAAFKGLGPALVGLGFLALTTEAGRPQRGINLFRHLRRSWMSRETLAFAIFAPAAGLDWLFPHPALRTIAALSALALMICQGFIVYRARGVITWNTPLMPFYFVTSGFSTGAGLMLVVVTWFNALLGQNLQSAVSLFFLGAVIAALNMVMWGVYLLIPDDAFQKATGVLRLPRAVTPIVGLGHLLPILLLLAALNDVTAPQAVIALTSGLALMFGGVRQKFAIVLEVGYLRAIALAIPRQPSMVRQEMPVSSATVGQPYTRMGL